MRLTSHKIKKLVQRFFLSSLYEYERDGLFLDGFVSFDTILAAADWIRGLEDNKPFSMKWLYDNFDFEENDELGAFVELEFSDIISDERGEAGHLDIIYMSQIFWTCGKGLAGKEWLCTCTTEWRGDDWIPSVKTIGDFKRLWRVATGYDLPLKNPQ